MVCVIGFGIVSISPLIPPVLLVDLCPKCLVLLFGTVLAFFCFLQLLL
jgi:hypothetical protein